MCVNPPSNIFHIMQVKFFILSLFCVVFISCNKMDSKPDTPISSDDFMYYGGGNASTLTAYNLKEARIQWTVDQAYAWSISIPVVENNVIYTGNVYGLSAINAASGNIIWKTDFGSTGYSQSVGFAPANNPVVSDSMIYLISYKGASDHSWLNAINKFTGAIVWQKDLSAGFITPQWNYTTPAVSGDKIYAIAKDNAANDRIFCLNKKTGVQIWVNNNFQSPDAYPLSYNNSLLIGNYGSLLKLNGDDGVLQPSGNIAPYTSDGIKPVLLDNNNLLFFGHNYSVYQSLRTFVINPNDGSVVSNFDISYEFQCTDKKSIFYSTYKTINAIDPVSHASLWQWDSPIGKITDSVPPGVGNGYNSPVLCTNDAIYYHQQFGVYGDTSSLKNSIFIIDKQTGILSKEIKLDKRLPLNKFIIVKDNVAYYPPR